MAIKTKIRKNYHPLERAQEIEQSLARSLSTSLGYIESGRYFEGDLILVIGNSGSGKTTEVLEVVNKFNASGPMYPDGKVAKILPCILDRKSKWKGLGRKTLKGLSYPLANSARLTQDQIWDKVRFQAKEQGYFAIWYDEAQHIFESCTLTEQGEVHDAFKTLLKSFDWPLTLIMSGVPQLLELIRPFEQLFRKVILIELEDIDFEADVERIHEIVGSYAMNAGLTVSEELLDGEFLHRLFDAAAHRWGLVLELASTAAILAREEQADTLQLGHFTAAWARRAETTKIATPFTHPSYEAMFPPETPFQARLGG